ncbi:MAG: hypothetical protein ABJC89_05260 [Acidobacteriota bacterium]
MPTIRSPRRTDPAATTVDFDQSAIIGRYTTAVSLHAHTNRSREGMSFIRPYLDRIPLVGPLARREIRAYERRNGHTVDFADGWWHPPVQPSDVWDSERVQVEERLGLRALVSISDHDSIDACLSLRDTRTDEHVPLSLEWTVPCGKGFLHVGVHNLPADHGAGLFEAMQEHTRTPERTCLRELLDRVHASRDTLVVLNHPMWDLAGIGRDLHESMVHAFLGDYGDRIHALELNGYRSAAENRRVAQLATAAAMPLVSGGDRHGRAPNSLLNLTSATSFGAFVREIREECRSVILVMPEYRQALVSRKLGVAGDAVRTYPSAPEGQQCWTERVSYHRDGRTRKVSEQWPTGGPLWVRSTVRAFERATRPPLLPALRLLVWIAGASVSGRTGLARSGDSGVASATARASTGGLPG